MIFSFILSPLIKFLAILVGYLTYSLDKGLTSEINAIAIRGVRRVLSLRPDDHNPPAATAVRNEALRKFILALSDQQLVTDRAILITAYYQRCQVYQFNFSIVATLAWFSSTTHLSTLAVLHQYLSSRLACRGIGMLAVFGLLFHAQMYNQ